MGNTNLTDEERYLLASTPALIGGVVSAVDQSGFFGTIKETWAMLSMERVARKKYPSNRLIGVAIFSNVRGPGEGIEEAIFHKNQMFERMEENDSHTPEEVKEQLLRDCRLLHQLLTEYGEPNEVKEYLHWLLDVGVRVAEAAREGGILGMGRGDISEREGRVLAEIREALGNP